MVLPAPEFKMKFPRTARMNTKAAYSRVFSRPTVSRDRYFRILARENEQTSDRLGMAVSKKNCRKATGRNRIKRVIRESFRATLESGVGQAGMDIVVLPTADAATICNKALAESLAGHWDKLAHKCAQIKTENRKN